MKRNSITNFQKIYYLYSSGLKYKDIKKLLKHDVIWAYNFYVKRMRKPEARKSSFYRRILFLRSLFLEFLLQLSPVRRLLYSTALLIFIWSYLNVNWGWTLISVFLFNILIAFELADKLTAKDELSVARDIQFSLMPMESPVHSSYQISFYCEPANEVGGDYFDFLEDSRSNGLLRIIIGDISGKGMAAALHMVQVKSIIQIVKENSVSPKEILLMLNKSLAGIFKNGFFFTTTVLNINPDNSVSFCRAGHLPLIYYNRQEEKCSSLIPKGIGIGLAEAKLFNSNLEQHEIVPCKGDILVLYTDGITETMNRQEEMFSESRLQEVINNNAYKPAFQIKDSILEAVRDFKGADSVKDDITLIVLKRL